MGKTVVHKLLVCFLSLLLAVQVTPSIAIAYAEELSNGMADVANDANGDEASSEEGASSSAPKDSVANDKEVDVSVPGDASEDAENASALGELQENAAIYDRTDAVDAVEDSVQEEAESGPVGEGAEEDASLDLGKFANSWRYKDGMPSNAISALTRAAGVTWSEKDGVYYGSNGMEVAGASAFGIDVSEHNGDIDWGKVKASGVDYAIIRIGYGGDSPSQDDKKVMQNLNGAISAGLKIGVYIYSYGWDAETGESEARHVLRVLNAAGIQPSDLDYPVYYDLEQEGVSNGKYPGLPVGIDDGGKEIRATNSDLLSMAKAFASTIESAGYEVGVYANLNWWNSYLTSSEYNQWDRWVAQYNTQCDYSGDYAMWQCMSDGRISGVSGYTDINFDFKLKVGLVGDENGIKFLQEDGTYLVDSWKTWEGKTYYFDSDGYALQWQHEIDGKFYYFNTRCEMVTGWVVWNSDGSRSYFDGVGKGARSGWQTIDGERYYFDPENEYHGARYAQEIEGVNYYFDGSCRMVTGWLTWNADGRKTYFDSNGRPVSGWKLYDGAQYYLDPNDPYCKSLQWQHEIDGKFYYFNTRCEMVTGWVVWNSDGSRSYFDGVGKGARSGWQTIDGERYYFDPENEYHGALWETAIDGATYYFDSACRMYTGWLRWNSTGQWSYFGSNGAMYTGKKTIYGVTYDFGKSGRISNVKYCESKVLDVPRNELVDWLSIHENSYYLGTRYSAGFTVSTCMYPKGAPRSDGFIGMNCTGFVAHAYRAAGGNLGPIAKNNNHSPWVGGPGSGSYINAWRWYGYAVDSGAKMYIYNSVSSMLKAGKAQKGDIIFFKTNGFIDCHIGFFWGDTPNQNKMWHQILQGNLISTAYNNANRSEGFGQKVVLIKGV